MKNGIVPIVLSERDTAELLRRAQEEETAGYTLTVDLERRLVEDARGFSSPFEIDDFRRPCLMEGLDDIALPLREPRIAAYEAQRAPWRDAQTER